MEIYFFKSTSSVFRIDPGLSDANVNSDCMILLKLSIAISQKNCHQEIECQYSCKKEMQVHFFSVKLGKAQFQIHCPLMQLLNDISIFIFQKPFSLIRLVFRRFCLQLNNNKIEINRKKINYFSKQKKQQKTRAT